MRRRPGRRAPQQTGVPPKGPGASAQGAGELYVVTQELSILRREVRCFRENVRGAPLREIPSRRRSSSYCEVTEAAYAYKAKSGETTQQAKCAPFAGFNKSYCRMRTQTHGDGPHSARASNNYESETASAFRAKPQEPGDGQRTPSYQQARSHAATSSTSYQHASTSTKAPRYAEARKKPQSEDFKKRPSTRAKMDTASAFPEATKDRYDVDGNGSSGSEGAFELRSQVDFDDRFGSDQHSDEDDLSDESVSTDSSNSDVESVDSGDFDPQVIPENRQDIKQDCNTYWTSTPRQSSDAKSINIYEEQEKVKAAYQARITTPRNAPPAAQRRVVTPRAPVDTSKGAIKKVGLQYFHKIPPPEETDDDLVDKEVPTNASEVSSDGPPVVVGQAEEAIRRSISEQFLKVTPKYEEKTEDQGPKARGSVSEPSLTVIRKPVLPVSFPYKLEIPPDEARKPIDFKSFMLEEPNTRLVCKREDKELTIYAIVNSDLGIGYFKAYELDSYLLFPVVKLPKSFPFDLSDLMLGKVPPKSTWQVLDHDLVLTSIFILNRHIDLFPKNLYLLIADKLFTTVDGMLQFFERDYLSLREIHACMRGRPRSRIQREAQLDTLRDEAMTTESTTIRRRKELEMKRVMQEDFKDTQFEIMEYYQKQREYIERLKPPCRIAPLPPRPQMWTPRQVSPEAVRNPPSPPSKADLAYLQKCYEEHGRPKVSSAPRTGTPMRRGVETAPQRSGIRRQLFTKPPPVSASHRRREYVRAARRRAESPSGSYYPQED